MSPLDSFFSDRYISQTSPSWWTGLLW